MSTGSRCRLSSLAEQDLTEIVLYLASESLGASDRFVDRFSDFLKLLARNPEMGESFEHKGRQLRRFSIEKYVAVYQVLPDEVLIVRVFHGARHFESLL